MLGKRGGANLWKEKEKEEKDRTVEYIGGKDGKVIISRTGLTSSPQSKFTLQGVVQEKLHSQGLITITEAFLPTVTLATLIFLVRPLVGVSVKCWMVFFRKNSARFSSNYTSKMNNLTHRVCDECI